MIRYADIKDVDSIKRMLEAYANAAPLETYHNPDYEYRLVCNRIFKVIREGVVLVATNENEEVVGMLMAHVVEDFWLPHIHTMRELAWWVDPQYRHTTIGYRLFNRYVEIGKEAVRTGKVDNFVITLMSNSPDMDLKKRGFECIERNYVYRGEV